MINVIVVPTHSEERKLSLKANKETKIMNIFNFKDKINGLNADSIKFICIPNDSDIVKAKIRTLSKKGKVFIFDRLCHDWAK